MENQNTLDKLDQIIGLLKEILAATKAGGGGGETQPQRPAQSGGYTPPKASQSAFKPSEEIPQPSEIIPDAGEVQVHFGKNQGTPLASLAERSLSWYAQEQEPRLKANGEPFPPREIEVTLRNAARTLWHQKKGTLKGSVPAPSEAQQANVSDDTGDDVLF